MNRPRTTVAMVEAAIVQMILKLNGAAPYTTHIPNTAHPTEAGRFAHFYAAYDLAMQTAEDADYPKVVIAADGGEERDEVSRMVRELCRFEVIFILKQIPGGEYDIPVGDQVKALIDDFKRLRYDNRTLGGLIENMKILDWTTDSGFNYPEGVMWNRIEVEYRNLMNG